jgi:hypothetical protein
MGIAVYPLHDFDQALHELSSIIENIDSADCLTENIGINDRKRELKTSYANAYIVCQDIINTIKSSYFNPVQSVDKSLDYLKELLLIIASIDNKAVKILENDPNDAHLSETIGAIRHHISKCVSHCEEILENLRSARQKLSKTFR